MAQNSCLEQAVKTNVKRPEKSLEGYRVSLAQLLLKLLGG